MTSTSYFSTVQTNLQPEEIKGLKTDLLYSNAPPAGKTKLTDWARSNASTLGLKYASELARRMNRDLSYEELN